MVLKLISKRLGDYGEKKGLLPEAQCGFRRQRSTVDMIFVARMLQEFGRDKDIPIYLCFIDLTKAYDTVDRKLLWLVLARFGVPDKMINIIRAFHDGMRATVRLGDGELSESFEVTRGLAQVVPGGDALQISDVLCEPGFTLRGERGGDLQVAADG